MIFSTETKNRALKDLAKLIAENKSEIIAQNKKAFHHFDILEKLEAGLVLKGYEVKSIRQGHISSTDA